MCVEGRGGRKPPCDRGRCWRDGVNLAVRAAPITGSFQTSPCLFHPHTSLCIAMVQQQTHRSCMLCKNAHTHTHTTGQRAFSTHTHNPCPHLLGAHGHSGPPACHTLASHTGAHDRGATGGLAAHGGKLLRVQHPVLCVLNVVIFPQFIYIYINALSCGMNAFIKEPPPRFQEVLATPKPE